MSCSISNDNNIFSKIDSNYSLLEITDINILESSTEKKIYSLKYYRKKKFFKVENNKIYEKEKINNDMYYINLGYTTNLNKDTPFIKFLIDKRIYYCKLGASTHIAAFIPESFNLWYYFLQSKKRNGRNR